MKNPFPLSNLVLAILFLSLASVVSAQHRHLVREDNDSPYYPVVKVDGFTPYIFKDGKARKTRDVSWVKMEDDFEYAPGYLIVGEYKAQLIYYTDVREWKELSLDFPVLPSQDYDDTYIVIKLYTVTGASYYVTAEIPRLKKDRVKKIRLLIRVKYEVDEGHFDAYYFSGAKEIYHVPTAVEIASKKPEKIRSLARNDTSPELQHLGSPTKFQYEEGFPQGKETVKVTFLVNDKGFSFDHKVLETSSNDLSDWVVRALKNSSFGPGSKDGFYEEMPLTLVFQFEDGRLKDIETADI